MRCKQCNNIFDQPKVIRQGRGCYENDYGVYSDFDNHNYYNEKTIEVCPKCDSENIEEIDELLTGLLAEYMQIVKDIIDNNNDVQKAKIIISSMQTEDFKDDDEYIFDIRETEKYYNIECNYNGQDYGWYRIKKEV